jgi:hypothetical protein
MHVKGIALLKLLNKSIKMESVLLKEGLWTLFPKQWFEFSLSHLPTHSWHLIKKDVCENHPQCVLFPGRKQTEPLLSVCLKQNWKANPISAKHSFPLGWIPLQWVCIAKVIYWIKLGWRTKTLCRSVPSRRLRIIFNALSHKFVSGSRYLHRFSWHIHSKEEKNQS